VAKKISRKGVMFLILGLKMHIDLPMKGLRRNDDAMKTDAGIIIFKNIF
jgi:hypothetical protein